MCTNALRNPDDFCSYLGLARRSHSSSSADLGVCDMEDGGHSKGKSQDAECALHGQSRWACLPPELLRDVINRMETSESAWPSRENIAVCAAVCLPWRKMCKKIISPELTGKLALSVSVKQPGPRDGVIQCYIQRDKSNATYYLYVCLIPTVRYGYGKFLLSAKRVRGITGTEYIISIDLSRISRSSSNYVGKLRSNVLGTKYMIYDTQPPSEATALSQMRHETRWLCANPKVPSDGYCVAQVTYEPNILGPPHPRSMHYIMYSIPDLAIEAGGKVDHLPHSLNESFSSFAVSKSSDITTPLLSKDSSASTKELNDEADEGKAQSVILRNKLPLWNEHLQAWSLNFRGRVTVPSVKNFQLIAADAPAGGPMSSQPPPPEHEQIILQFGKVAKDMYSMDYRYPLSAFQAFAICLSSFGTKLACHS